MYERSNFFLLYSHLNAVSVNTEKAREFYNQASPAANLIKHEFPKQAQR